MSKQLLRALFTAGPQIYCPSFNCTNIISVTMLLSFPSMCGVRMAKKASKVSVDEEEGKYTAQICWFTTLRRTSFISGFLLTGF